MKRFPFFVCLAFLILLVMTGIASADSADTTTTTPEKIGGSIYFETVPNGATIWLDDVEIGTSVITYYSPASKTYNVRIKAKGFEEYTDTVTVSDGKHVEYLARLTPIKSNLNDVATPATPVATATTVRKSTMEIPTPWPSATPESPVDPALVTGAAAIAIGFFVIRRR